MRRVGLSITLVTAMCVVGTGNADAGLCGKTLSKNLTLRSNLHCKNTALIVGADNVVVNLNHFEIIGNLNGDGIDATGHTNVTIKNGTITHFNMGIVFDNVSSSFIKHVSLLTGFGQGITLKNGSSGNQLKS